MHILDIISYCKSEGIKFVTKSPLALHCSLKIGGNADIIVFPTLNNLNGLIKLIKQSEIPFLIIGGGTNMLFPDDGFRGIVISTKGLQGYEVDGNIIKVGAGNSLWSLIQGCIKEGLSGLENLSGIPGTVGGAVFGNAGAFGIEMKDVVISAEIIDHNGNIRLLENKDINFTYRQTSLHQDDLIIRVNLSLKPDNPSSIKDRVNTILSKKKATQPINMASAGCVFKNPEGDFAGRLIDMAGLKGMTEGDIMVSPVHANFFVNTGRGTEKQFLTLICKVRDIVYKSFNKYLELEIKTLSQDCH